MIPLCELVLLWALVSLLCVSICLGIDLMLDEEGEQDDG